MKKTYQVKFNNAFQPFHFVNLKDGLDFNDTINKLWGKYGHITIDNENQKSNNQNDFFRGPFLQAILEAFRDMGHEHVVTKDDALFEIKNMFFVKRKEQRGSEVFTDFYSTCNKDWKKKEWEDKLTQIRVFFAGYGYNLPLPNERD